MQTQEIISNPLERAEAKKGGTENYLRALGGLFGFDLLYVSFLMILFFKHTRIFEPIQREFDLTAIMFSLLILGWGSLILQRGYRKNTFSPLLLPPMVLLGWLLCTLLYSMDWVHGFGKVLYYLPTTSAAFLVGYFVIAPDDRRVRNVFIWLIVFASFLSYINVESYYLDKGLAKYWVSADRDQFSSYIDRSLVIVSAATVVICSLFDRSSFSHIYRKFLQIRPVYVLLLALFLWGIVHGGARQGFVLFLAMPLFAYSLFYISKGTSRRLYISLVLLSIFSAGFLFFYHFAGDLFETSIYRRVLEDPEYYGFSTTRARLWLFSWLLILEEPLRGIGFGGFRKAGGQDYGYLEYPHNLFLEIWLELGLFGLLILFLWIVLFCKQGSKVLLERKDSLSIPTLLVALVWFLSLQVSGSWVESRFSAAFLGIFAGRIAIASSRNRPVNSRNRAHKAAKNRRIVHDRRETKREVKRFLFREEA